MKSRKSRAGFAGYVRESDVHTRALGEALKISAERDLASWSHVRRCHRCGDACEQIAKRVESCRACGARFAPFFFSELTPQSLMSQSSSRLRSAESLIPNVRPYRPIVGLTWWWSETSAPSGESLMPRA